MAFKNWKKVGREKWYNTKTFEYLLITNNAKFYTLVLLRGTWRLLLNTGKHTEMVLAATKYMEKN